MGRDARLTFTKLADEPWFLDAARELRDLDNDVAYTITAVTTPATDVWLEKRVSKTPETWEAVAGITFDNVAIYRSGTMVGGTVDADLDAAPPAGSDYRLFVRCEITATAEYGAGVTGKVLWADVTILPSAVTAPAP